MTIYADGSYNHASGTRDAFGQWSDALVAEGHPEPVVIDGDREEADQLRIWYDRMTLDPGGRRVYGTAWWNGQKWYRIHPDAVGVPGSSNHQKRRSNDLAWPYNSDTDAARRAEELASNYNITREGRAFGELWHWTHWGPLGTIGAHAGGAGSSAISTQFKEDDMSFAMKVDGDPQRGPVECAVGHRPNPLSQEEFDFYYGGRAFICSARQYDVNLARHLRLVPVDAGVFLGKGSSPDRPWTLFAPGYVFPYAGAGAAELLENQPFTINRVAGNDRQYDLWIAQATHGTLPAVDAKVDLSGLTVNAEISDVDVADIAKAVNDDAAKRLAG